MRRILLVAGLLAAGSIQAQELWKTSKPVPNTFKTRPEAQSPRSFESESVRRLAGDWIKTRATSKGWKFTSFQFLGILEGRPADELPAGAYQVYRAHLANSPDIGRQRQTELLFYGQGKELIWPPENWPRDKAPPGQNNAAVLRGAKQ